MAATKKCTTGNKLIVGRYQAKTYKETIVRTHAHVLWVIPKYHINNKYCLRIKESHSCYINHSTVHLGNFQGCQPADFTAKY